MLKGTNLACRDILPLHSIDGCPSNESLRKKINFSEVFHYYIHRLYYILLFKSSRTMTRNLLVAEICIKTLEDGKGIP